jgi:hypothetical protein
MQGTKVIRVYNEGLKKLDRINSERPQDNSRADTFDYILRVFEESPLRIVTVTPTTMADKLYADKLRMDALRATNAALTKNIAQGAKNDN